jgi:SAM-dependent methyltransferase
VSLTATLPAEKRLDVRETCPLCACPDFSTVYREARDPITLDRFRVVKCRRCCMIYTLPRPASMERFYPPRYRAYGWLVTRILRLLYMIRVSRWTRSAGKGRSVLEIGCGPGLMLEAFSRRGWQAFGIERNDAAAEAARRVAGTGSVFTSIEELPPGARYDLIVMFHVLEHIGEPLVLLRECARRLAKGGRLIINVPNFASWQSRFAGSKWLHLDVPRHLVHFTPRTLEASLERAGVRVDRLGFASLEHDPYGWVESMLNRISRRRNPLTRFLMGLDPFGPQVFAAFLGAAVLFVPALLLSAASWVARRGALVEIIAVESEN